MSSDKHHMDQRFLAAAVRLARSNEGQTGTNPSVACVLVKDGVVVGTGVTAIGGRPHAEPIALEQAGNKAKGATAYVTLEPCAHHGRTPPCAQTLINAGVSRVVGACTDPDDRVSGKGYAMLRAADIDVEENMATNDAARGLEAYLKKRNENRPFVTLKLAITPDGIMGLKNGGQLAVTGAVSKAQTHLMRARHDAILVGSGTVLADDPDLTCRLNGLAHRSPIRVILDVRGEVTADAKVVETASKCETLIVTNMDGSSDQQALMGEAGVSLMPCEIDKGRVALPEMLDDLSAKGISSIFLEGGAKLAKSFLDEDLVDAIELFVGPDQPDLEMAEAIRSPVTLENMPKRFNLMIKQTFQNGDDEEALYRFEKVK